MLDVDVDLPVPVIGQQRQALRHRGSQPGCDLRVDLATGTLDELDGALQSSLLVEGAIAGRGDRQPVVLQVGQGGKAAGHPLETGSERLPADVRGRGALLSRAGVTLQRGELSGAGWCHSRGVGGISTELAQLRCQL